MVDNKTSDISPQDDEIDLLELSKIIWDGKWVIIAITTVFAVGSVIYALSLPDIYRAEVLISPVEEGRNSLIQSQLGGLANLAGIDIGSDSGTSQKVRALATIQSRAFIRDFVNKHDLLVPLMASRPAGPSGVVEINPEVYDEQNQEWVRGLESPRQAKPTDWEVYRRFSGALTVEDDASGLVTIALEWYDPEQITTWLDWLITDLNESMRQQDVSEARRGIEYLNEQLQRTQLVDMRNVFYNLIEQQTRTVMLADAREGYVFQTIDPPFVPDQKAAPSRSLICIIATILGGLLATIFVLVYSVLKNSTQKTE